MKSLAIVAFLGLAAACGSAETTQPTRFDDVGAIDFGGAELYFMQLDEGRSIWSYDETVQDFSLAVRPDDDTFIRAISANASGDELFALTVNRDLAEQVQRVTTDGLAPIAPSDQQSTCFHSGRNGNDLQYIVDTNEDFDPWVGALGAVVGLDVTSGSTTSEAIAERYIFCPIWSDNADALAFGGPREGTDDFTVALHLNVGDEQQTVRITGCAFMPMDFNSNASSLAVSATCEDAPIETGLYLFDTTDLGAEPELLRLGRVGAAAWSPDDAWLAYSRNASPDPSNAVAGQVEILELGTNSYVQVLMVNTSWPVWIVPSAGTNGAATRP